MPTEPGPELDGLSELVRMAYCPPSGGDGRAYLHAADSWHPSGSGLGGPVAATTAGAILVGDFGAKLGSAGVVESSLDGGKTWSAGTGLPANESVDALATDSDQGNLYAYCFSGDVFSSADTGKTWTLVSSALRALQSPAAPFSCRRLVGEDAEVVAQVAGDEEGNYPLTVEAIDETIQSWHQLTATLRSAPPRRNLSTRCSSSWLSFPTMPPA